MMIKVIARLLTLVYLTLLTIALINPAAPRLLARHASDTPWALWFQDHVHFWTMATLTVLLLFCRLPLKLSWMVAGLVVYATLTEFSHILLPERAFQWVDLGQNLAGVTSVILLYLALVAVWSRRIENQSQKNG